MQRNDDVKFLQRFPHLTDWLNLNGYALIYSHRDEYKQIHTMWSDRSSAPVKDGSTDARNWITIIYCEHCNVVDVFKRVGVGALGNDEQLVNQLENEQNGASADSVIGFMNNEDRDRDW